MAIPAARRPYPARDEQHGERGAAARSRCPGDRFIGRSTGARAIGCFDDARFRADSHLASTTRAAFQCAIRRTWRSGAAPTPGATRQTTDRGTTMKQILDVEGMSCGGCERLVGEELLDLDGVSVVRVPTPGSGRSRRARRAACAAGRGRRPDPACSASPSLRTD